MARQPALTGRELQVLLLTSQGVTNAQIAQALFLSEDTIKTHMRRMMTKLQVSNRLEAVLDAMRRGLIPCACGHQPFVNPVLPVVPRVKSRPQRADWVPPRPGRSIADLPGQSAGQ